MPSLDSIITFSTLAALVQFGIIISVILRVMLTRHPPGSAFAWILITTLLPYFGFILYLLRRTSDRPTPSHAFSQASRAP